MRLIKMVVVSIPLLFSLALVSAETPKSNKGPARAPSSSMKTKKPLDCMIVVERAIKRSVKEQGFQYQVGFRIEPGEPAGLDSKQRPLTAYLTGQLYYDDATLEDEDADGTQIPGSGAKVITRITDDGGCEIVSLNVRLGRSK